MRRELNVGISTLFALAIVSPFEILMVAVATVWSSSGINLAIAVTINLERHNAVAGPGWQLTSQ